MSRHTVDLTGQWQFAEYPSSARKMSDLDSVDWYTCNVPGSIYSCLAEAGQISVEQLYSSPESLDYIGDKPWVFRKSFDVNQDLLSSDKLELVFDGLDTITIIWLNGKLISRTDNMFVSHRINVTDALRSGSNTIMIKFESAVSSAKALMNKKNIFKDCHICHPEKAYIRKSIFHFGHSSCPTLSGCGIWRSVRLEAVQKARINDFHIRTIDCDSSFADVKITVAIDRITSGDIQCKLTVGDSHHSMDYFLNFDDDSTTNSRVIRIDNPDLWWPLGYGDQPLYDFTASLTFGDTTLDHQTKQIGLRTVRLDRSKIKNSSKFTFKINSKPIDVRGVNWLSGLQLPDSAAFNDSSDYKRLLNKMADANLNMVRIVGSGYYQDDDFYNHCDKLGIMVWQDFMFSSSLYPLDSSFIGNLKHETQTIIKQLRNHCSLVLWCGNDKINWLFQSGYFGRSQFKSKSIFSKLLPDLLHHLDPDRPYIPTTPFSKKKDLNNPTDGTFHAFDSNFNQRNFLDSTNIKTKSPAFIAESGLASMPSSNVIKLFGRAAQLYLSTLSIDKHNYRNIHANSDLFRTSNELFGPTSDLAHFAYLTQVTQARSIKKHLEHLSINPVNSGVLFWHLNDCFPSISFSLIDYLQQPKAAYYYIRRFSSDLSLIASIAHKSRNSHDLQSIELTMVNRRQEPVTAAIVCRHIDLSGNLIDELTFPAASEAQSFSSSIKLPKSLVSPSDPQNQCLHLLLEKDGKILAENSLFYLPDKYINWPQPSITCDTIKIGDKVQHSLKSSSVIKDIYLQTGDLNTDTNIIFSDNYFDLFPGFEKTVTASFTNGKPIKFRSTDKIGTIKV